MGYQYYTAYSPLELGGAGKLALDQGGGDETAVIIIIIDNIHRSKEAVPGAAEGPDQGNLCLGGALGGDQGQWLHLHLAKHPPRQGLRR